MTYASPLCGQRSEIINDMLGLPGVTQPPVAAESTGNNGLIPIFIDLPPIIGFGPGPLIIGGPIGPGPITFPGGPTYPPGPGPIIIAPPGPPGPPGPPVTSPVPEPASWAAMLIGMMLLGGGMRRRNARPSIQ